MAIVRHLRKVPITEAIIDIRVNPLPDVTARTFDQLRTVLVDSYPLVHEPPNSRGTLKIEAGKIVASTTEVVSQGLHFKAADSLTVAQFRSNGFTLNRLKPYTS